MKSNTVFSFLVALTILALTIGVADDKSKCTVKETATAKSSCSAKGTSAAYSSETKAVTVIPAVMVSDKTAKSKDASHCATIDEVSSKECAVAKQAKLADECTPAEKAACESVKASGKMDCCKDKAKMTETKTIDKKSSQVKLVDGKGTD